MVDLNPSFSFYGGLYREHYDRFNSIYRELFVSVYRILN
jgi:hypothetical protein